MPHLMYLHHMFILFVYFLVFQDEPGREEMPAVWEGGPNSVRRERQAWQRGDTVQDAATILRQL